MVDVIGQARRSIGDCPQGHSYSGNHHRHPRPARSDPHHGVMLPSLAMRGNLLRDMAILLAATLLLGTLANLFPNRRLAWIGAGQQPPQVGVDFQWMDAHSAEELRQSLPEVVFVDTRSERAYAQARIPGAVRLSYTDVGSGLPAELEEHLRTAQWVLLYGDSEDADIEQLLAQALRQRGLAPPYIVAGGLPAWQAAGLPIEEPSGGAQ